MELELKDYYSIENMLKVASDKGMATEVVIYYTKAIKEGKSIEESCIYACEECELI